MPLYAPTYFSLPFMAGAAVGLSPADSTAYVFGNQSAFNPGVSSLLSQQFHNFVDRPCVLRGMDLRFEIFGTLGSTENVSVDLIVSSNTVVPIVSTAQFNSSYVNIRNYALNTRMSSGDTLLCRFTTPAWATNPTAVYMHGTAHLEVG